MNMSAGMFTLRLSYGVVDAVKQEDDDREEYGLSRDSQGLGCPHVRVKALNVVMASSDHRTARDNDASCHVYDDAHDGHWGGCP